MAFGSGMLAAILPRVVSVVLLAGGLAASESGHAVADADDAEAHAVSFRVQLCEAGENNHGIYINADHDRLMSECRVVIPDVEIALYSGSESSKDATDPNG